MNEIIEIVNQIARALFHASAQTDDDLAGIESLADLHAAQERTVDAVNDARPSGYSIPAATSVWQLLDRPDEDGGGQSLGWTTGTGRLDILAEQPVDPDAAGFRWRLTMRAEAGPNEASYTRWRDAVDNHCVDCVRCSYAAAGLFSRVKAPDDAPACTGRPSLEGRPVLEVAWSNVRPVEPRTFDWVFRRDVQHLDSGLLAEKPGRVSLLVDCARRARLDLPSSLANAIRLAEAHAEAIRSLTAATHAALNAAASPVVAPLDVASVQGLVFTPDDFAEPAGRREQER